MPAVVEIKAGAHEITKVPDIGAVLVKKHDTNRWTKDFIHRNPEYPGIQGLVEGQRRHTTRYDSLILTPAYNNRS